MSHMDAGQRRHAVMKLGVGLVTSIALCLSASCGGSSQAPLPNEPEPSAVVPTKIVIDRCCDEAFFPSSEWSRCETQNFAKFAEARAEQLTQPAFVQRELAQSVTNTLELIARDLADPSWLLGASSPSLLELQNGVSALQQALQQMVQMVLSDPASLLSSLLGSLTALPAATYALGFVGDPYRYPDSPGPNGRAFYEQEAQVTPVVFYDAECARLSGRVWQPRAPRADRPLPGVVIMNGSFEAPETLLWWAAQLLVRNGYVVLTFDPRGQGRSDFETPDGVRGSNANPRVFWTNLVDAIDFFRSAPDRPYPHNLACQNRYPTVVLPFNPAYWSIDPERLGIAGHSAGALGVSVVQGYGAVGADPWPGRLDQDNPVKAAVGWDGIADPVSGLPGNSVAGGVLTIVTQIPLVDALLSALLVQGHPPIVPRVPTMSQDSEYGVLPTPYLLPPPSHTNLARFRHWSAAEVPWYGLTVRGSSHLEWAPSPLSRATSWCPSAGEGRCSGGWGNAMAQHYTLAWFDRWLKQPGEAGYADADQRLLDDGGPQGGDKFSFHFRSGRRFADRSGHLQHCDDIRAGC